eukprot:TRINITY_DN10532_c0_g1_i1.p1 TRINITY_DN10532_c0_g1~~TRINITY_DN10532_c0_g1_i1.p1  ORF type:complete len:2602 (+),score=870.68 TRINITY_DN10532_c0_g1_i1:85-7806(+)
MGRHAPLVVRFSKIWEDFVDVQWQFELYHGETATQYHLLATAECYKVERFFTSSERSFRLVGLEPGCLVKVSVRAQYGEADWGEWATCSANLHSTCDLSVGQVGGDFIHGQFEWGKGKEDTPLLAYARAAKFQLKVRQKEYVLAASVCDQELEATQREVVVRGLSPGGVFGVQVRAVSTTGDVGLWCDEVRFLTLADVIVRVREVGEDYAVVWWGRDGDEGGAAPASGSDNSIEHFALRLELVPDERSRHRDPEAAARVVDEQAFTGETNVYTMRHLEPGRSYDLWTRHLNIQGDWSPWRRARFRTMDRVGMVSVVAASHNFLHICWEQECSEDTKEGEHLPINNHVVNWEVRCVNTVTHEKTSCVLPRAETSTKIVNLPDSTEFELAVRAKTGFSDWGPWGQAAFASTLPPLKVSLDTAGENWLTVTWGRPEKKHDDGISRYHLQLSAAETPFRLSKYFPQKTTEFRFTDLLPGHLYHASIQACVCDRWQPWSEPTPVRTAAPAEISLVRRGEDFVHLSWLSDYYTVNKIDPQQQRFQLQVIRLADEHMVVSGETEEELVSQEQVGVFNSRVSKLRAGSRIGCRVRAYDLAERRWSNWSEQLAVKTLPSVVTFTMVAETCVEVAWQQRPRIVSAVLDKVPIEDDPLAPGEAVMYILRINEVDEENRSTVLQKYHFTDQDKPFFIVEQLKPNCTYSAQLCTADANQAWSPWSAAALVTTVPRLQLQVEDLGEDYCTLQWQREQITQNHGGISHDLLDESDTKYRVVAQPLCKGLGGGVEHAGQLNYTIEGDQKYTVRHLAPATSYRVCISAYPKQTNIWGVWSKPVFIRTNDPIEVDLDAVGEDYAHVSWRRVAPSFDELEDLHPGCDVQQVGGVGCSENPAASRIRQHSARLAAEREAQGLQAPKDAEPPVAVHIADYAITEFEVKVFRIELNTDPRAGQGSEPRRIQEFERFVANDRDTLRIPQLSPNQAYEVQVCACNRRGEWGVWSNALPFRTTMPTEMVVADITQEHVKVRWGRGVASGGGGGDDPVSTRVDRYQLKIVGRDDDLSKEIILPGSQREYCIQGLSVNCCYEICVRTILRDDDDWGHWCNPIYVALRSVKVSLVETSQDWLKISWANKAPPDGRLKRLFITLIGDHRAVTTTLPTGGETEHAFSDLNPLTVYSVHLLCAEHVPAYVKAGGVVAGSLGGQGAPPPPVLPEGGRPTDAGITVALPLVAADYSCFYSEGAAFSTLANIAMEVVKVGENFVTVRWGREVHAHGAAEVAREREASYDVCCHAVGGVDAHSPGMKSVCGTEVTIPGLTFNTLYELKVRKVSLMTSAWSRAATVQTLDRVKVQVGPAGVAGDDTGEGSVGVGEDFILLNWEKGLCAQITHSQHAHFEVRCVPVSVDLAELGEAESCTTGELSHKLTGLEPDTRYKINVRSVIDDDGTPRVGEWCDDIVLATLAPMAVRVVGVTEETAVIEWLRKGEDPEHPKAVHTVGSYHIKVYSLPRVKPKKKAPRRGDGEEEGAPQPASDEAAEETEPPSVLLERQLLEDDVEFGTRRLRLTGLKPAHMYTAMVRASTENTWGSWSTGVTVTTQARIQLEIGLVGEEAVFLQWTRSVGGRRPSREAATDSASVQTAPCESYELTVSTVGRDASHSSRMLQPEPNRYRLSALVPNTQYSVRLRPCYPGGQLGPWSEQQYFVTLAPMRVEVSRIGETFVHVRWHRVPQQRIADRLREQHKQQQEDFEEQQLELQREIDALASGHPLPRDAGAGPPGAAAADDDGGMFDKHFLAQQDEGATGGADLPQESSADLRQRLDELQRLQREQQQRQRQLRKLQELQMLDLERETRYPDGRDLRYEVVITALQQQQQQQQPAAEQAAAEEGEGAAEGGATPAAEHPKERPAAASKRQQAFTFRRRINCSDVGECKTCKMDGLLPHTTYTVTVRAMYSNGYSALGMLPDSEIFADKDFGLLSLEQRDKERHDAADQLFWGAWSPKAELCTLKQISLSVRGIGSCHCVVDWDTGFAKGDAVTAVSQYQLMIAERDGKKGGKGSRPCQDLVLENPNLESWTVVGLQPSTTYTVTIRVYYDDDRCGMWSTGICFLTLPRLSARVQSVAETRVEVLVWREVQRQDDPSLLVWRPAQCELQLAINEQPSPSTFKLDLDQSTLLTLDDLTIDSEYNVRAREVDANNEWREWHDVVKFETLPCAPSKPQLDERRGHAISISWNQRRGIEGAQYLYAVEMAYVAPGQKGKPYGSEHGPFSRVGFLSESSIRLEPGEPVHRCLFRVKVCKGHQRLEDAQAGESEEPYLWSAYSPVAHFHAPSVPQPPSQLKIINLRDNAATVKWRRPENWRQHTNLVYKIYLSDSYQERPVCLGSTSRTSFRMEDLVPNTHYRVGVTAESSMGVSQNNHVLHFSTRVLPMQGPLYGGSDNPTSSTLPPRTEITIPRGAEVELSRCGSPMSDARSHAYSGYSPPGSPAASRMYADDIRSLASAATSPQRQRPSGARSLAARKGLPQRPATTEPGAGEPLDAGGTPVRSQSTQPPIGVPEKTAPLPVLGPQHGFAAGQPAAAASPADATPAPSS